MFTLFLPTIEKSNMGVQASTNVELTRYTETEQHNFGKILAQLRQMKLHNPRALHAHLTQLYLSKEAPAKKVVHMLKTNIYKTSSVSNIHLESFPYLAELTNAYVSELLVAKKTDDTLFLTPTLHQVKDWWKDYIRRTLPEQAKTLLGRIAELESQLEQFERDWLPLLPLWSAMKERVALIQGWQDAYQKLITTEFTHHAVVQALYSISSTEPLSVVSYMKPDFDALRPTALEEKYKDQLPLFRYSYRAFEWYPGDSGPTPKGHRLPLPYAWEEYLQGLLTPGGKLHGIVGVVNALNFHLNTWKQLELLPGFGADDTVFAAALKEYHAHQHSEVPIMTPAIHQQVQAAYEAQYAKFLQSRLRNENTAVVVVLAHGGIPSTQRDGQVKVRKARVPRDMTLSRIVLTLPSVVNMGISVPTKSREHRDTFSRILRATATAVDALGDTLDHKTFFMQMKPSLQKLQTFVRTTEFSTALTTTRYQEQSLRETVNAALYLPRDKYVNKSYSFDSRDLTKPFKPNIFVVTSNRTAIPLMPETGGEMSLQEVMHKLHQLGVKNVIMIDASCSDFGFHTHTPEVDPNATAEELTQLAADLTRGKRSLEVLPDEQLREISRKLLKRDVPMMGGFIS